LLVVLTSGAKDIYVVVKDAAGNVSAPLKIAMNAYTATSGGATVAVTDDSTDITSGTVKLTDGKVIAYLPMTQQRGGTWLITAPIETDLTRVGLTFTMPHADATIDPENGSVQNFENQTVTYEVTAADEWTTASYEVRIRLDVPPEDGTLVTSEAEDWAVTLAPGGLSGQVAFSIAVPIPEEIDLDEIDHVTAELGYDYSQVNYEPVIDADGNRTLRITGIAPNEEAMGKLAVSEVSWSMNVGTSFLQKLGVPITYEKLESAGNVDRTALDVSSYEFPDANINPTFNLVGCDLGSEAASFMAAALGAAAIILAVTRKKRR
jgi:hypothetical protein